MERMCLICRNKNGFLKRAFPNFSAIGQSIIFNLNCIDSQNEHLRMPEMDILIANRFVSAIITTKTWCIQKKCWQKTGPEFSGMLRHCQKYFQFVQQNVLGFADSMKGGCYMLGTVHQQVPVFFRQECTVVFQIFFGFVPGVR